VDSTIAAIARCKTADDVFASVNWFLAKLDKTSNAFRAVAGPLPVRAERDVRVWLFKLKDASREAQPERTKSIDELAQMYAVCKAANRRLEAIQDHPYDVNRRSEQDRRVNERASGAPGRRRPN